MKRIVILVSGVVGGILLAGVVAPGLVWMLPPDARSARVVWATAAVVVALTTWALSTFLDRS